MWYRPSAFADVGVAPPRSWSDLQAMAPALAKPDVTPLAVGGGDGWVLTDWFENVYLRTAGAGMYDQLACHEIAWTDPTVKFALATLGQVLRPDWLAGGRIGALATTFPKSVEQVFGDSPSAVMLAGGDFVAGALPPGRVIGVDARFFPFPAVEGSRPAVVAGGDVAVVLSDNEAAMRLIRFLATPEAAEPWARAGGFISPNQALDLGVYPNDSSLSLVRAFRETEVLRYDLSDQQPASFGGAGGQGMWRILQDFLRDPAQVDRTAGELEAGARVANIAAAAPSRRRCRRLRPDLGDKAVGRGSGALPDPRDDLGPRWGIGRRGTGRPFAPRASSRTTRSRTDRPGRSPPRPGPLRRNTTCCRGPGHP